MDLEKLYETVVLRDVFEYLFSGSIVLLGTMLVVDATLEEVGINFSLIDNFRDEPLWIAPSLFVAYMMGQLLASIDVIILKRKEGEQEREVLDENEWLKSKLVPILAEYTETLPDDVEKLLSDSSRASSLREIGRAIIYKRQPELYLEFVSRHSIHWRLFKNISLALAFLLLCLSIAALISWGRLTMIISSRPALSLFLLFLLVGALIGMIRLFMARSAEIRKTMIKHTFQLLYVDHVLTRISDGSGKKGEPVDEQTTN